MVRPGALLSPWLAMESSAAHYWSNIILSVMLICCAPFFNININNNNVGMSALHTCRGSPEY